MAGNSASRRKQQVSNGLRHRSVVGIELWMIVDWRVSTSTILSSDTHEVDGIWREAFNAV